jgi:hypothetical protein
MRQTGDSLWPNNQRIHHFEQEVSITIPGSPQVRIDKDIVDARSCPADAAKGVMLTPTGKSKVPCSTVRYGINNCGSLAGTAFSNNGSQGFLDYVVGGMYGPL